MLRLITSHRLHALERSEAELHALRERIDGIESLAARVLTELWPAVTREDRDERMARLKSRIRDSIRHSIAVSEAYARTDDGIGCDGADESPDVAPEGLGVPPFTER